MFKCQQPISQNPSVLRTAGGSDEVIGLARARPAYRKWKREILTPPLGERLGQTFSLVASTHP